MQFIREALACAIYIAPANSLDRSNAWCTFDSSHLNLLEIFFFSFTFKLVAWLQLFYSLQDYSQWTNDRSIARSFHMIRYAILASRGATLMIQCHCQPVSFAVVVQHFFFRRYRCCCNFFHSQPIFGFAYLIRSHSPLNIHYWKRKKVYCV